jgi:transcriptional regulator GlxA family with amidase domain
MEEDELDACFQATYGITLRDYILNRRFTAAKELLRFTIKPVKEIIDESGIGNDDLFRRLFQDGEGMTAEEYRMKWAQWVK